MWPKFALSKFLDNYLNAVYNPRMAWLMVRVDDKKMAEIRATLAMSPRKKTLSSLTRALLDQWLEDEKSIQEDTWEK